jgi:hypothetical protein
MGKQEQAAGGVVALDQQTIDEVRAERSASDHHSHYCSTFNGCSQYARNFKYG